MSRQIYINLPVNDLGKSTSFYEALGFIKNPDYSDKNASAMMWSEQIIVMLLTHDFYKRFIKNRQIADTTQTNSVLLALSFDSKDSVQQFADAAKANGGNYYSVDAGVESDTMFGYEVEDPDGHIWEPTWMDTNFDPKSA